MMEAEWQLRTNWSEPSGFSEWYVVVFLRRAVGVCGCAFTFVRRALEFAVGAAHENFDPPFDFI